MAWSCELIPSRWITEPFKNRLFKFVEQVDPNANIETFLKETSKASHAFIFWDKNGFLKSLAGFSFFCETPFTDSDMGRVIMITTTVLDRKFQGSKELQKAYTKLFFKSKLHQPLKPLYFGFATRSLKPLLLITRNFPQTVYQPNLSTDDPALRAQASLLFQNMYNDVVDLSSFSLPQKSGVFPADPFDQTLMAQIQKKTKDIVAAEDALEKCAPGRALCAVCRISFSDIIRLSLKYLSGFKAPKPQPLTARNLGRNLPPKPRPNRV